jgi:SAM-dependent methyltransferase
MSHETGKATDRRLSNTDFWDKVFKGRGIDIGAGDDPLRWQGAKIVSFDLPTSDYPCDVRGDANRIDETFTENQFDFVHGSQVLEHLFNPIDALQRMIRIVKPGGYVIITVPDYDLYEQRTFPSQWNGDHKSTWSLWRQIPPTSFPHIWVPDLRRVLEPHEVTATLADTNYDYMAVGVDQTWEPEKGVEAFIEILIKKHGK